MENYESYFSANKISWNKRTGVHKDSAFYDLAGFKSGQSSLNKIELHELGDVKGKTLLHLQCHFGMDTLSWEREGAIVTGVDLSDEAIKLANEVKAAIHSSAEFICCNVYDLEQHLNKKFDIVFTSYGTIGWLPDLNKWAGIVSHFLKPFGIFYIADFHPVLWTMDNDLTRIQYSYFNKEVITEDISGSYSDRNAPIRSIEHSWNHPLSDIFNALISHGMHITQFNEFAFSPYNCFNNLQQGADGMWRINGMDEKIPMMYSIKAVKESLKP
jgi:ubiquinone/menaquinone biosynthesis C-methylase UbiE